ncbi:hypothetical protein [Salibacter sp.]|uniref:hypothetical protein n=1 Tax=Salibacter sp. TaxID=2010995 RepID=UPI0028707E86|nr:hypothetical protein [Salibacter sp.]MDR9398225.1 hypothetical protein [Salibacter sp.]MDR9487471.1 hypothetical protein [Salibacter sp.]
MKKHNGMRPHDIVVLLKIASKRGGEWFMKDLAYELGISSSEISESLNRSAFSGLIGRDKKKLNYLALIDFLEYGLMYIYPQRPGAIVRGIATAHSAEPLNELIMSEENYVIPYAKGDIRGQMIEPLHPSVPEACMKDELFYKFIALTDSIRVGRAREKKMAVDKLKKMLRNAQESND